MVSFGRPASSDPNAIKPSKLYTCQHCEASFYGRNLTRAGLIPNHRWLHELCKGSGVAPEKG